MGFHKTVLILIVSSLLALSISATSLSANTFEFNSINNALKLTSSDIIKIPDSLSKCFQDKTSNDIRQLTYIPSCTECSATSENYVTVSDVNSGITTIATISCKADLLLLTSNQVKYPMHWQDSITAYASKLSKQDLTLRFKQIDIPKNSFYKQVLVDLLEKNSGTISFHTSFKYFKTFILNYDLQADKYTFNIDGIQTKPDKINNDHGTKEISFSNKNYDIDLTIDTHKLVTLEITINKLAYQKLVNKIKTQIKDFYKEMNNSYLFLLGDFYSFPQPYSRTLRIENNAQVQRKYDISLPLYFLGDSYYDPNFSNIIDSTNGNIKINQKIVISRIPFSNPWPYLIKYAKLETINPNDNTIIYSPDLIIPQIRAYVSQIFNIINGLQITNIELTNAFQKNTVFFILHGNTDGLYAYEGNNGKTVLTPKTLKELSSKIKTKLFTTIGCQAGSIITDKQDFLVHSILNTQVRNMMGFLEPDLNAVDLNNLDKLRNSKTVGEFFLTIKNQEYDDRQFRPVVGFSLYGDPTTLIQNK